MNNKIVSILDDEYQQWLADLKIRYKKSQIKASISVNSELLRFYWMLGKDIVNMKATARWGSKFFETLSKDLKEMFPNPSGFSPRNIRYMCQFYELFPDEQILQQLAAKLFMMPWGHLVMIMGKCNEDGEQALFYINETIKNNWSRAVLYQFLESHLYERQGKAINNFDAVLPKENGDLANQLIKDPYSFDFLEMTDGYKEKELKDALINNIQHFLVELGTGFAFMGREYRLEIDDAEEFIDMLFYNTRLHAYVVIEVKITDFKPADIGQLGTYVVAVDHLLKTEKDEKTIGLLVCKTKKNTLARYALESSNQPLGISSYELSKLIPNNFESILPSIEELEGELNKIS